VEDREDEFYEELLRILPAYAVKRDRNAITNAMSDAFQVRIPRDAVYNRCVVLRSVYSEVDQLRFGLKMTLTWLGGEGKSFFALICTRAFSSFMIYIR
jgi:hypothetical protein